MLAFFRICRYNLYCALRRRIEVVITGLTRNQVASRGLEGSNPSVSASATGNAFKCCLFSSSCAGGNGEPEPLRGLELHAIGQPCCYILIRFVCQQSLKGESLRPYSHSRKCFQALPFFHPVAPAETKSPSPCEDSSCTRLGNPAVTFLYALRANCHIFLWTLIY